MIAHVVLYRFPPDLPDTQRTRFCTALVHASRRTGVVRTFTAGTHVPLPADAAAPDALYSMSARWVFSTLDDLRVFSEHPAMIDVVDGWVRRFGIDVGFANSLDEVALTDASDPLEEVRA